MNKEEIAQLTDSELLKVKEEYEGLVSSKNAKQTGLKILMNACYGAMGTTSCRYYDLRLASAITLSGQWAIKWVGDYLEKSEYCKKHDIKLIYTDTDSVYLSCENLVENIKKEQPDIDKHILIDTLDELIDTHIQPIIDEAYAKLKEMCNANENRMFMKREVIAESGLWLGKKKYAINIWDSEKVRFDKPKLKAKGVEIIRSSTPAVIRKSLKKAFELLLVDKEKMLQYIVDYEANEYDEFTSEQISFPRGVNGLEKWADPNTLVKKGCPIQVRGAILYNKFYYDTGKVNNPITEGSKIKFVYLRTPNPIGQNVISFPKHVPPDLVKYVDRPTMFEKTFKGVLRKICDIVGVNIDKKKYFDMNDLF